MEWTEDSFAETLSRLAKVLLNEVPSDPRKPPVSSPPLPSFTPRRCLVILRGAQEMH